MYTFEGAQESIPSLAVLYDKPFLTYWPPRARICKPFNEPRNRFPTWRASIAILFDVPARKDTSAGGIDTLESIPGLLKRLQIRAQATLAVGIDSWAP